MKAGLILFSTLFFVFHSKAQINSDYNPDLTRLDSRWILDREFRPELEKFNSLPRFIISDLRLFSNYQSELQLQPQKTLDLKLPKLPPFYDYSSNIYDAIALNSKSWISTARINTNFIGLGAMSSAGAQYNLKLNNYMLYSVGTTVSKYNIYNSYYNDVSLNSSFRLRMTNRLSLNLFGNYTPNVSDNNMVRMLNSSMLPQTNYGGAFEFKVNDKWGLMTGAKREYDVIRRKWVTQPFIMPVFYSK